MKRITLLAIAMMLFAACDKTEIPADKGKPNPNAMILIKPGKQTKSARTGMSNTEIVQEALYVTYTSHYSDNKYEEVAKHINRGFNEQQKDFDIPALKMLGIDVVSAEGDYYRDLTYARDVYIVSKDKDTIAYVPDAVINTAREAIEAAWDEQDYNTIYELFNTAFTFLPLE